MSKFKKGDKMIRLPDAHVYYYARPLSTLVVIREEEEGLVFFRTEEGKPAQRGARRYIKVGEV